MDQQHSIRIGNARHRQAAGRHVGMTILETVVAAAMLAVFLVSATRVMATISAQQRAAQRHALALQTANNLLEELTTRSWQALTPQAATEWAAEASLAEELRGATVSADVIDVTDPVAAKRVLVSLMWESPRGRSAAPIRLAAWVYPPAQADSTEQPENIEP